MSPADPTLSNRDLDPVPQDRRTWSMYNYIALWFSLSMGITAYQLASSLIARGMNWKQAIVTVLLGNLLVLVPMLLNSHAGAKYGIPYPVFVRAPFGVRGANLAAVLRAIVACGWFGIQSWIGGSAVYAMLAIIAPRLAAAPIAHWACFLGFWLLNMVIVWRGIDTIRRLQAWGAPFLCVMAVLLLVWVRHKAGSFGSMLSAPSRFHSTREFLPVFFPSLTAVIGYWATIALNIPDFTRYSKSQGAQAWGQAIGLPVAMTLFTFVGISVTSASTVLFGRPIWDPVELIGLFHEPHIAFISMIAIVVATLNINVGANVVSPSNDFSNLYPRLISFRTGGIITGFFGIAMCPWKLLATPDAYVVGWLVGYSGLLGPIAGIMIADYYFIRHTTLDLQSLYRRNGAYSYTRGINPRAIVALALGVTVALIGLFVARLHFLYDYAWFVGFFVAGAAHITFMRLAPPVSAPQTTVTDDGAF